MTSQTIIIGAGITGIAAAQKLRENGYTGNITLFEKSSQMGGRLVSHLSNDNTYVYEMGAGRFHEIEHNQVKSLCRKFKLAVENFDYDVIYRQTPDHVADKTPTELLAQVMQHATQHFGKNKLFHEFCKEHLEKDAQDALASLSGYTTMLHEKLPLEGAIAILQHHPETQSLFNGNMKGWFYIKDGFQRLADELYKEVADSVDVQCNADVKEIKRTSSGRYSVSVQTPAADILIEADNVIMATPLEDALNLKGFSDIVEDAWQTDLQAIPLVKGFIKFDRPWWNDLGYSNQCIISDKPLKKLYFLDQHKVAWFYCDGPSATALNGLLKDNDSAAAMKLIAEHLNIPTDYPSTITDYKYKHWERGISFNAGHSTGAINRGFAKVAPGFVVCSDVMTDHLGWIEGCLTSATTGVKSLLQNDGAHKAVHQHTNLGQALYHMRHVI